LSIKNEVIYLVDEVINLLHEVIYLLHEVIYLLDEVINLLDEVINLLDEVICLVGEVVNRSAKAVSFIEIKKFYIWDVIGGKVALINMLYAIYENLNGKRNFFYSKKHL